MNDLPKGPSRLFRTLLALLVLWPALLPAAEDPRIAPEVWAAASRSASTDARLPLWVEFKDKGLSASERQAVLTAMQTGWSAHTAWRRQRAAAPACDLDLPVYQLYVRRLIREGARIRYASRWLNAVSLDAEAHRLNRLANAPEVRSVRLRAGYHPPEVEVEPSTTEHSGPRSSNAPALDYGPSAGQILQIKADKLHAKGLSGHGVVVCMIDTGFRRDHEALSTRPVLAERDFIFRDGDTGNGTGDVATQWDHGTGTWAVLGGFAPGMLIGPAYGAEFLLAKTEDVRSETRVEEDNFVAAAEWADNHGADVISTSLGYLSFDDGFSYAPDQLDGATAVTTRAVNAATEVGIAVCVAAGNEGPAPSSLGTPADAFNILTVGAVKSDKTIADFSSRGPTADGRIKPEVVAQGFRTYWANASAVGRYAYASGTSLATPLVGGGVALLLESHPDWSPLQVREALIRTANRKNAPDNIYGFGLINLKKANRYRFR